MRSPGATGPAKLSVTGRRYSSGWAQSQRLKLRAKASGYCSPRQRETGVQGHEAIPNSPSWPCGGGAPGDIHHGPGQGEGVRREDQEVQSKILPGPDDPAKDRPWGPEKREVGPPFA